MPLEACMNFVGLNAVGENLNLPIKYYDYNISGILKLLGLMDGFCCNTIVFSLISGAFKG